MFRPYQQITYAYNTFKEVSDFNLNPFSSFHSKTFALFFSSINNVTLPRTIINDKIIVVGGGTTGIAFLMSLITKNLLNRQVIFSNLTLVTPHAFSTKDDQLIDDFFIKQTYLTKSFLNMYSFDSLVNMIFGTMTAIDRDKKHIRVDNNEYFSYDFLILTCGQQYQYPQKKTLEKGQLINVHDDEVPKNMYIINTDLDAKYAIDDLMKIDKKG